MKSPLFWSGRVRGLFSGLGYALSLTVALVLTQALQDESNDIPRRTFADVLHFLWGGAQHYGYAMLPAVPLLIATINLTAASQLKRSVWLTAAVLACGVWASVVLDSDLQDAAWIGYFVEHMFVAALLAAVCVYHNSARGAQDTMLRSQIESATLSAEFERARLQMLRSQIQPHFLFNTLANVRSLARSNQDSAAEMIDNIMRYLAAALPKLGQDHSTLSQEMALVDAYLNIYRVRMGARLSFAVALPSELAQVPVPTMMLLTLVENALKHGIDPAVTGGFIRVSAARAGSSLILKVADSGHGIAPEHLHGTGTGLANVRLRLMMQYGEAASLSLAHAEPRGVVAAISLPLISPA